TAPAMPSAAASAAFGRASGQGEVPVGRRVELTAVPILGLRFRSGVAGWSGGVLGRQRAFPSEGVLQGRRGAGAVERLDRRGWREGVMPRGGNRSREGRRRGKKVTFSGCASSRRAWLAAGER